MKTFPITLAAYAEDIRNRSFLDWLRAHTSFLRPLYRFDTRLEVLEDRLVFEGRDVKANQPWRLEIPFSAIRGLSHDYDETYRRSEDRQMGLFDFKPLRIDFGDPASQEPLYIFAGFHRNFIGAKLSRNDDLIALIEGQRKAA